MRGVGLDRVETRFDDADGEGAGAPGGFVAGAAGVAEGAEFVAGFGGEEGAKVGVLAEEARGEGVAEAGGFVEGVEFREALGLAPRGDYLGGVGLVEVGSGAVELERRTRRRRARDRWA